MVIVDTQLRVFQGNVIGYINHSPGQALCPGVVDQHKMTTCFIVCVFARACTHTEVHPFCFVLLWYFLS